MSTFQYLSAFRLYGADVLILALGVTLVVSLLKKTVCKKLPKKLFVALPFLLGIVVYAAYRLITAFGEGSALDQAFAILEGGFAVGCAATLYYVVYEQFFRSESGKSPTVLGPLLVGILPDEEIEAAEQELLNGRTGLEDDALYAFVLETLSRYGTTLTDAERSIHAKLIAEYLAVIG